MPLGLHTTELNFETTKEIGQEGKNSQVFLAHDKQLDGEIVVKKLRKVKLLIPRSIMKKRKSFMHPHIVML